MKCLLAAVALLVFLFELCPLRSDDSCGCSTCSRKWLPFKQEDTHRHDSISGTRWVSSVTRGVSIVTGWVSTVARGVSTLSRWEQVLSIQSPHCFFLLVWRYKSTWAWWITAETFPEDCDTLIIQLRPQTLTTDKTAEDRKHHQSHQVINKKSFWKWEKWLILKYYNNNVQ